MMKINNPPWELMAKGKGTNNTASGPIVTFRGNGAPLRSLLVNIEPVQEGSGEPSPDNVRPISGWSAVNVWRTGKNLFDISQTFNGTGQTITGATISKGSTGYYFDLFNGTTGSSSLAVKKLYLKAGTYTLSGTYVGSGNLRLYVTDASGAAETTHIAYINSSNPSNTFTLAEDSYSTLRYSAQGEATITNLQLELGSTATPYEPYSGNQYTIQLGQTVYGATLDVKNGVLTVDRVSESFRWGDYKATDDFTVTTRRRFAISDIAVYPASGENRPYCNVAKWAENYTSDAVHFYCNSIRQALVFLPIGTPDSTEIQIVYTLATPITIPLTPTQISTLQGQNNVWADSGDVELTYKSNFPDKSLMKLAIAFINRR